MSSSPAAEAARRRTFAIISHPDAGKTTLTENLLLAGGAIRAAGAVRARGQTRRTQSDWMKIERERGISVSASVMTFDHDGLMFNLLDTPGHEDFSEDTYRTLTAADAAIMVLDAAKGIEPQTLKLFEVCRLRDIPIITFINKLDREAQDPFEPCWTRSRPSWQLDPAPLWWPAESGGALQGHGGPGRGKAVPALYQEELGSTEEGHPDPAALQLLDAAVAVPRGPRSRPRSRRAPCWCPRRLASRSTCQSFLEGHMTPVFCGARPCATSASRNC